MKLHIDIHSCITTIKHVGLSKDVQCILSLGNGNAIWRLSNFKKFEWTQKVFHMKDSIANNDNVINIDN